MLRAPLVALALLLAGCAASVEPPTHDGPTAAADLPPGCDASRPAVAHRVGGVVAETGGPLPIPCLSRTGFASSEPTLAVSPTTGAVFFFPAYPSDGNFHAGGIPVAASTDEGATWTALAPATAERNPHVLDLDPYLFLDEATGRLFVDTLTTLNCSVLSWSDDEGAAWSHALSGCLETDHQTLFAGPPVSSATVGYPNVVYRCAMNTVALAGGSTTSTCQRSLDGGRTWLAPGAPAFVTVREDGSGYCDGAVGHGVVDARGRVYLPKGLCGEPWLATSDDEGLTWTRVRVSDLGMHREAGGYPGHDAGVGVDAEGNVYYFWIAEDRLPRLAVSRDGGATWGDPRMVGAPGVREATMPALVVTGVGEVAFLYLGSENSAGPPFPTASCDDPVCVGAPQPQGLDEVTWNGYIGTTRDALADDPVFVTVSVNDPADPLVRGHCGAGRCQNVYDFLDLAAGPDGSLWGSFVDTCVGACVEGPGTQNNAAEGVVGRLWRG